MVCQVTGSGTCMSPAKSQRNGGRYTVQVNLCYTILLNHTASSHQEPSASFVGLFIGPSAEGSWFIPLKLPFCGIIKEMARTR